MVAGSGRGFNGWLCHDDRAGIRLAAGDLSSSEPAPGSAIRDTELLGINAQLHTLILAQMFLFVGSWTQNE
jgi:hypothetical protein